MSGCSQLFHDLFKLLTAPPGARPANLSAEQVIDEVERSGLRGRGGGGFPTGQKCTLEAGAEGTLSKGSIDFDAPEVEISISAPCAAAPT